MKKKDIIFLIILGLIVFIPIIINEINEYNLRNIKKEVLSLSLNLKTNSEKLEEIKVNKELKIDNKTYNVKGNGNIFVSNKGIIVILSYKNYCIVKVPLIDEVSVSKGECPKYILIKNTIIRLVEKDGLVKEKDSYYYKGNADNYLMFNNELWHILSFENKHIRIIKKDPIKNMDKKSAIDYLNNVFYNTLDKSKVIPYKFDISDFTIENKFIINNTKSLELNVGMLSVFDYQNTLNEQCRMKNKVLICGQGFIKGTRWLSNYDGRKSYYLYSDNNIYTDDESLEKYIYPVLYLKDDVQITEGYGTLTEPYKID